MTTRNKMKRGQAGGRVKNPKKGFGSNTRLAQIVAKKGGMISRRGVAYKTHTDSIRKLLDKITIREWADMVWEYEPSVEIEMTEFGQEEVVISSFSQDLEAVSSALLEDYVGDYEDKYVKISDKMYDRLQAFVDEYLSDKEDEILDEMKEDQMDYLERMRDQEADYRSLVGA